MEVPTDLSRFTAFQCLPSSIWAQFVTESLASHSGWPRGGWCGPGGFVATVTDGPAGDTVIRRNFIPHRMTLLSLGPGAILLDSLCRLLLLGYNARVAALWESLWQHRQSQTWRHAASNLVFIILLGNLVTNANEKSPCLMCSLTKVKVLRVEQNTKGSDEQSGCVPQW